jgi:hypothetical protein
MRVFGPEREELSGWRKLHNEEFHSLYSLPGITSMSKSRRMGLVWHVALMEEMCVEF